MTSKRFALLVVAVAAAGCGAGSGGVAGDAGAGTDGGGGADAGSGPITELPGPGADPANRHVPDIVPPAAQPSDRVTVGEDLSVSRTEIGLVFKETTTVQEANAVLAAVNATVVGTVPEAAILLVTVPSATLAELMAVVRTLNRDAHVDVALNELFPTVHALPPANHLPNLWSWALFDYSRMPAVPAVNGNWGLEIIRAPQMWNLDAFVRRNRATMQVSAAAVDNGFGLGHADLGILVSPAGLPAADHGTVVSGIMGATFGNGLGTEGIDPWLTALDGRLLSSDSRNLRAIYDLLRTRPEIKAINNSWGWSYSGYDRVDDGMANGSFNPAVVEYGDFNGDRDHADMFMVGTTMITEWPGVDLDDDLIDDTWEQVVAANGKRWRTALDKIGTKLRRNDFMLVGSAGNDGPRYRAVHNSPIANASAGGDFRFLSVMSLANDDTVSPFSTVGGAVAAPGSCVRSTEVNDATAADDMRFGCTWTDPSNDYMSGSGTSYAAPFVTGLIAALWKLEPTLSFSEVYALVALEPYTVATAAAGVRRIDAFNAAMGIDVLKGNKNLQTALVDVDDGTADGNQRTTRGDDGAITGQDNTIHTADARRGDGQIGMGDFRAFRDAVLQAGVEDGTLGAAAVSLDGAANHPKMDLNGDGCVRAAAAAGGAAMCGSAPGENVHSRFDFNGDGRVDPATRVKFKEVDRTDLEVLADVWPSDPALNEGWGAASLSALLAGSADVEVRTELDLGGGKYDEIRVTVTQAGSPVTRKLTTAAPRLLWTIPTAATRLKAEGWKGGAKVKDVCRKAGSLELSALKAGQDSVVTLAECPDAPGPSLVWRGSVIGQARTTYYNVDLAGNRVGDQHQLEAPLVAEGDNSGNVDPGCATLVVGDTCTVSDQAIFANGMHAFTVAITRPSENVFEVTGMITSSATKLPLLEPPPSSNTFCGDTRVSASTTCYSQVGSGLDVFLTIPMKIPGTHPVSYACEATGEAFPHPESSRNSFTKIYVGFLPGGPVTECQSASSPQASWHVMGTHDGPYDTTSTSGSFGIGSAVYADTWKSYTLTFDYQDTVHLTLTRMRITVGP